METIYNILLPLHVLAGFTALSTGFLAILSKKGMRHHIRWGRWYVIAMLGVCFSALVISLIRDNRFLLHIGIFSCYMAYNGQRVTKNKQGQGSMWDLILLLLFVVNGLFMLISQTAVLMVFGGIAVLLSMGEIKWRYALKKGNNLPQNQWLIRHIGMMGGAYISTFTAFLVVNVEYVPMPWLPWLMPTIIGSPLIALASRRAGKVIILLLISVFGHQNVYSQPYIEGGNTRHRFAQLNVGTDYRVFPDGGTSGATLNAGGQLEHFTMATAHSQRLMIGGTHFWGHADFFLAIPLHQNGGSGFGTGVETGARFFPWRIESRHIRPYLGFSWLPVYYQQGDGPVSRKSDVPVTAGMVYCLNKHLFDLGFGHRFQNTEAYPLNRTQFATIQTHNYWLSVGYRRMIETTAGAEKDWLSGRTQRITDTLSARKKLNGWTIGIGPSSAFFTRNSSDLKQMAPYAGQHKASTVFPELNVGYYWHQADVQFNAVYRRNRSNLSAYGFVQDLKRSALSAESFAFLGDYHGFAPFAGLALSQEWLELKQTFDGQTETQSRSMIRPGLTAGWDIRPNRLQTWYLRTSLRYFPLLNIRMSNGLEVHADQLEVNFIQLVVFPGRL